MSIGTDVKGTVISKVIRSLSNSEPITTFLGFVLAALVAANINYSKVLNGDTDALSQLISCIIIAALGFFTNRKSTVNNTLEKK